MPEFNPYQPPKVIEPHEGVLGRWLRWFTGVRPPAPADFAEGGVVIVEGIAFYVNPSDASVLFAASPSETTTDERMDLIVAETLRVLPIFLEQHPNLQEEVRGRTIVVRMIAAYDSADHILRERAVETFNHGR